MRIAYFAGFWPGSTTNQRADALARRADVELHRVDSGVALGREPTLYRKIRWRLRLPVDATGQNARLLAAARELRPDAIIVDNAKVLHAATLERIRRDYGAVLAYYTPDDIMAPHNLSRWLRWSFRAWDVVFTTKTFNVPELAAAGVARPVLVGKAFDPDLHRPLTARQVGADYEAWDCVFIGSYERERHAAINALAEAGVSVKVHGEGSGGWDTATLHPRVTFRPAVYAEELVHAMHHGRIALNFLRRINRDRITQRSMEIAAMGRAMLAEKTDEHDAHYADGSEYVGFHDHAELVAGARELLADDARRTALGSALRARCLNSGYSTDHRAESMLAVLRDVRGAR